MSATGTATLNTGAIQSRSERPLANQTTISDSRKLRVIVVRTAMNRETARITGNAVILEKVANPTTTSAPMAPAAASPSRRTSKTLSHTTSNVETTTPAWLRISDTTERLNSDISEFAR